MKGATVKRLEVATFVGRVEAAKNKHFVSDEAGRVRVPLHGWWLQFVFTDSCRVRLARVSQHNPRGIRKLLFRVLTIQLAAKIKLGWPNVGQASERSSWLSAFSFNAQSHDFVRQILQDVGLASVHSVIYEQIIKKGKHCALTQINFQFVNKHIQRSNRLRKA